MTTPLALTGLNASGLPIGDDDGYDTVDVATNPDGDDQLIEITQLPCRPMYFQAGFTLDHRLYVRRPGLLHALEVDAALGRFFNWRLRVTDPYRPWNVQAQGHTQAVADAARAEGLNLDDIKGMLGEALDGRVDTKLLGILKTAQPIFSAVPLMGEELKGVNPQIAKSAANLGLGIGYLELNKYSQNTHATGGVIDCEPIDADTNALVNMGCPVDTVAPFAALGYFEPEVPTILVPDLEKMDILSSNARLAYFRNEVSRRDALKSYLAETGVNVGEFLTNGTYFLQVISDIQANRRGWGNALELYDMRLYGLEWWHTDTNDARGGVRSQRTGIVSGGPSYAIYKGQEACAWGNCTRQYEAIVAART